jgi:hypothetical protein
MSVRRAWVLDMLAASRCWRDNAPQTKQRNLREKHKLLPFFGVKTINTLFDLGVLMVIKLTKADKKNRFGWRSEREPIAAGGRCR